MSRESGKKSTVVAGEGFSGSPDSIETFLERLRDRCEDDGGCDGLDRSCRIQVEAERALALADEFGIVRRPPFSWQDFLQGEPDLWIGTEHLVDLSVAENRYRKTTIPPAFGLIPKVVEIPNVNLRGDPCVAPTRRVIEFVHATPMEYLERWAASNEMFGDDVRLVSAIHWQEGFVSLGVSQPQYHGVPAEYRDIERCFVEAGWTRLKDPSGHAVFFNYAFGVMAIDAERRNCYLTDGQLQPFDVILCRPDEAMQAFLSIYPDS